MQTGLLPPHEVGTCNLIKRNWHYTRKSVIRKNGAGSDFGCTDPKLEKIMTEELTTSWHMN